MPAYQIEVLAIKNELYSAIQSACSSLNRVQSEFRFEIPSEKLRTNLFLQKREKYKTTEIFEWLRQYRVNAKGNRPYTILVVDGFLASEQWENIFGSAFAKEGLATFTMLDFDHFVQDVVRYVKYYLVRYVLSFVQPQLKNHTEPGLKTCMLHFKQDKQEMKHSLDSGHLCERCRDILRPKLTDEINTAIEQMLQVVSNQHAYSLVLKGGGAKGLAFVGALLELEKYYSFDSFIGTSAGAITAVLLGSGYKPAELNSILGDKDFTDFKDANWIKVFFNVFFSFSMYPGNTIREWMSQLLRSKLPGKLREVAMEDLPNHTVVYCSRTQDGIVTFDSKGTRRESHAAFAARCSMSIPFVFSPVRVDNIKVYDGGLRCNFPLKTYEDSYPNRHVLGLYLVSAAKNNGFILNDITNIAIDGEEFAIVENSLDRVIVIDPRPIKTTEFELSDQKKQFLLLVGRLGALEFLKRNRKDIAIDLDEIPLLKDRIKELRHGFGMKSI